MKLIVLDPHGNIEGTTECTSSIQYVEFIKRVTASCIRLSCQQGICGNCLFKTDRPDAFFPPDEREQQTLTELEAKTNERLACRARLDESTTGSLYVWNGFSVYNPRFG